MPWPWHTGPQPHASPSTVPCHGGRCPLRQLQSVPSAPGIAPPSMTIVSWADTSRIESIDGMAAAIVAAMTSRTVRT